MTTATRSDLADLKQRLPVEEYFRQHGSSQDAHGKWRCLCAANHTNGDADPSVTIKNNSAKCWSQGCFTDKGADIFAVVGVVEHISDFKNQKLRVMELVGVATNGNGQPTSQIIMTYDYCDEHGDLLYQVVRYAPKNFRQRRPDGHSGWIWSVKGVRAVVFHLPDLPGHRRVYDGEGEKNAERMREEGLAVTCNSGGAGKWTDAHAQQVKAAGVQEMILLPNNDNAGRAHVQAQAQSCVRVGLAVKIVTLPNLPPKGDVSDWFDADGTKDDLERLADLAPYWVPATGTLAPVTAAQLCHEPEEEPVEPAQADRPELDCDTGDLDTLTTQAWQLVATQNHPELLFRLGTLAVRLEDDEHGRPRLVELTDPRLRYEVASLTQCTRSKRSPFGGHVLWREDCKPPQDLISNMLAAPSSEIPLPRVRGIVEVPVVSADGVLIQIPGYDRTSGLLYRPYDPTVSIAIPTLPTSDDLTCARSIIDEVFIDFPFASTADRTNAVGLMIVPFVRHYIPGPTPNHLFEAPGPGAGKGLAVEVSLCPAVGSNVGTIADARDEDEMRKRITARLLEGRAVTLFDNITRTIDSGVISSALTSTQWEDRRLGKTETLSLPVSTIWVMTANNPVLSMEIARRSVRVRLDPQVDRPWQRNGFRHPNLKEWVQQERAPLIRAILTLIQGWLAAGEPAPTVQPLGSFESWTRVVGGILEYAGYQEFLGNALALYETADTDSATWRTFTTLWWEAHHDQPVGGKDLFVIAKELDGLNLGKSESERGQRSSLGRQLKKRRDQVIGIYRIEEAGSSNNAQLWRLTLPLPITQPEEVAHDNA